MKVYTKIYMKAYGYDKGDFIPCEICESEAVDIHHIEARQRGGSKTKDVPENLMALCRADHEKYGDVKECKDLLKQIHLKRMNKYKIEIE